MTVSANRFAEVIFLALTACNAAIYREKRATYYCSNSGMTDSIRNQILNYHNAARWRVARGIEPNNIGLLAPAKNMYRMDWDCNMEQQAQAAIASCPKNLGTWSNMAQNLQWYTNKRRSFRDPAIQINSALNTWWGAARQYGVTDLKNGNTNINLNTFANMVFPETTKIGCAYNVCPGVTNTLTFTCLYNKIGYFTNHIWETGSPCVSGADCTTYANSGCSGGLCIKGADAPDTTYLCPYNNGMTDLDRQTILSLHNNYRSRVARGLEYDALGGYAPRASKMLKMVYDCSVEASAIRNADKCIYEHSAKAERPNLGENIWYITAPNFDKVKAARQASQFWWDELKNFGVGQSNNLTHAIWNRPYEIGHYTQMAWETSYRLGCAVASCSSFTYVVCQYGPGGNHFNRLIYTIGNPCGSDAECPGSYTCSVAEGLCNVVETFTMQ